MDWLKFDQLPELQENADLQIQTLLLYAEIDKVPQEIPTPPLLIPLDGVPSPTQEWFGRVANRVFVIESQADVRFNKDRVITLRIPFVGFVDWSVLTELRGLPESIHISRPLFMESRATRLDHVVFRPNPRGWSDPLYQAASVREAEDLLRFLRGDPFNNGCFIDEGEAPGEWVIIDRSMGKERIIGRYTHRVTAFKFACHISERMSGASIVVRSNPGTFLETEYRVDHGRVV